MEGIATPPDFRLDRPSLQGRAASPTDPIIR
jgi:hypothetical protein